MDISQIDIELADIVEKHKLSMLLALVRDEEDIQILGIATTNKNVEGLKVLKDGVKMAVLSLKDKLREVMSCTVEVSPSASGENAHASQG